MNLKHGSPLALLLIGFLQHSTAQLCDRPIDLVFVIDDSGSICDDYFAENNINCDETVNCECPNWITLRNFLAELVSQFSIGPEEDDVRVGLIKYGNNAVIKFYLDQFFNKQDMIDEINAIQYEPYQNTNTQEALRAMRAQVFSTRGDRDFVQNVAIVITDGESNINKASTIPEARAALDSGIMIIAVGIGVDSMQGRMELAQISSRNPVINETYFMTPDVDALSDIIEDLVQGSCQPPPCSEFNLDLTFIMDSSGSICDDPLPGTSTCSNYELMKDFVIELIERLPISDGETRVALIVYGNEAQLFFNLNRYNSKTMVQDQVRNAPYYMQNTNTAAAIQLAIDEVYTGRSDISGDRPALPNVIIILTDGVSTINPQLTLPTANEAKRRGAAIFTVGITEHVSEAELKNMSSDPQLKNVNYFMAASFENLENLIGNLEAGVCEPESCRREADIVFLLDASGSIEPQNFEITKEWLIALIDRVEVDSGKTRIGLVVFSDNAETRFRLNSFSDRASIQNAVSQVPYLRGSTNTAQALLAADAQFTQFNGDRENVMNVIVIVTDGGSNDKLATSRAASQVKDNGAHVIIIGVGDWTDNYEIYSIASHPYEYNSLFITDFTRFDSISQQLIEMICDNIDDCRLANCQGGQCMDMIGTYMCMCENNMGGINCQYECREPADVVIALDSSFSIQKENYLAMTDFTRDLMMDLPMQSDVRMAMMAYSDRTQVYFDLNNNRGKLAFLNDMSAPQFMMGTTDTALALQTIRETIFNSDRGDRDGVRNVAVLVTDGRSDSFDNAWEQAKRTRESDIDIITVGINTRDRPYADDWESLASWPESQNVMQVSSFDDLDRLRPLLREAICNSVDACASNPCQNFGECVDMTNAYHCECINGYTGFNCERECDGRLDVIFVLDRSGSIPVERFRQIQNFLSRIVLNMEVWGDRVRVALITFDDEAQIMFDLDEYRGNLQDAAAAIKYSVRFGGGKTNIASAMDRVREVFNVERGDRRDVPNMVITFTDGGSNIRADETVPRATDLKIDGARLITVAVGMDLNMLELRGISSRPEDSNLFHVDLYRMFDESFFQDVLQSTCDEVNECLSNPCRMGSRCIDLYDMFYCDCANDFSGRLCDRPCRGSNDVVLLLDISGSLDPLLQPIMAFTEHVVYGLEFQQGRNRLSVVTYSDEANVRFFLNQYSDTRDLLNAIAFMERGGRTNTAEALRTARTQVLTSFNGDRSGIPNSVVVVTDGGSNVNTVDTLREANQVKSLPDTEVFVVPVGEFVDLEEVSFIASSPEHVLGREAGMDTRLITSEDIERAANQLLDVLCQ